MLARVNNSRVLDVREEGSLAGKIIMCRASVDVAN